MDKPPLKPVSLDANLLGQFWTSAADVFIEIVKSQDPDVRQSIDRSISSGGDVEITAHNQAERITVTLIEESGQRQVIFDDMVVAVKRFIFVAILTIIGSAPALADVRIVLSLGGTVGSYLSFFLGCGNRVNGSSSMGRAFLRAPWC